MNIAFLSLLAGCILEIAASQTSPQHGHGQLLSTLNLENKSQPQVARFQNALVDSLQTFVVAAPVCGKLIDLDKAMSTADLKQRFPTSAFERLYIGLTYELPQAITTRRCDLTHQKIVELVEMVAQTRREADKLEKGFLHHDISQKFDGAKNRLLSHLAHFAWSLFLGFFDSSLSPMPNSCPWLSQRWERDVATMGEVHGCLQAAKKLLEAVHTGQQDLRAVSTFLRSLQARLDRFIMEWPQPGANDLFEQGCNTYMIAIRSLCIDSLDIFGIDKDLALVRCMGPEG